MLHAQGWQSRGSWTSLWLMSGTEGAPGMKSGAGTGEGPAWLCLISERRWSALRFTQPVPDLSPTTEHTCVTSEAPQYMEKASHGRGDGPGDCAHPTHPPGPPVYWPRKETLSDRLPLPAPLVPSRAAQGWSLGILLFSDDSWGESDSDSEPGVEREGPQRGW
jgi:hypothetical protein